MLARPMPRMDTFVCHAPSRTSATPGSAAACSAGVTTVREASCSAARTPAGHGECRSVNDVRALSTITSSAACTAGASEKSSVPPPSVKKLDRMCCIGPRDVVREHGPASGGERRERIASVGAGARGGAAFGETHERARDRAPPSRDTTRPASVAAYGKAGTSSSDAASAIAHHAEASGGGRMNPRRNAQPWSARERDAPGVTRAGPGCPLVAPRRAHEPEREKVTGDVFVIGASFSPPQLRVERFAPPANVSVRSRRHHESFALSHRARPPNTRRCECRTRVTTAPNAGISHPARESGFDARA